MKLTQRQRFQVETSLFFVASLVFVAISVYGGWFHSADKWIYDGLIKASTIPRVEELVIVGIDEQSLEAYGPWPWSRSRQAELLETINQAQPRAILLDVVFAGSTNAADDSRLTAAASAVDTLALPMIIDAVASHEQLIEVLPFPDLLAQTDVVGHVHVELDQDAIVRGTFLHQGINDARWPHLTLALARHLGVPDTEAYACPDERDVAFSIQNRRCSYVYTPFVGPPGSFPEISALDLLQRHDAGVLRDKLVFVGVMASGTTDLVTTPVSGESRPMSGIEYNANLYSALAQNLVIRHASPFWVYLINLLCVSIPVLTLPRLRAKGMLGAALTCALIPVSAMALILIFGNRWLPLASAAVICLLAYPYWSWRRHEVAWKFIETEIQRLEREQRSFEVDDVITDHQVTLERLATLLDAELVTSPVGWLPGAEDSIDVSLHADAPMRLRRAEPFSPAEKQLTSVTLAELKSHDSEDEGLPGELLIAEIRRLQTQAEEVRLGREIGQRGLEQMPIGVSVFSNLGELLFINSAGRRFLGFPAATPTEYRELLRNVTPALGQNWQELIRNIVLDRRIISFETRTAGGEQVVIEAGPLAGTNDPGDGWVLTITDMTDIRTAEREREEALAFLSHDLRSPMLSVLALVRGSDRRAPLDDIGDYAQRALQVSDQFLQLSRVQAREAFERYEINILAVVRNAVEQMYALARDKNIELAVDPYVDEDEEGVWLSGNGELLERAFVNLLGNAIKYSQPDSEVAVQIDERSQQISIHIVDNGAGIPESEVDRIFDPFFRSSAQDLARERGAGLGLRFVKTVIERHGGSVAATSEYGKGSRFTVTLPKLAET